MGMNWQLTSSDRIFLKHLRIAPEGGETDDRPCPACRTGLRRTSMLVRRLCPVCGGTGILGPMGPKRRGGELGAAE